MMVVKHWKREALGQADRELAALSIVLVHLELSSCQRNGFNCCGVCSDIIFRGLGVRKIEVDWYRHEILRSSSPHLNRELAPFYNKIFFNPLPGKLTSEPNSASGGSSTPEKLYPS